LPADLPKGPAIENAFQHKVDELRQQFRTLEHVAREGPGPKSERLSRVVAALQRSLEELQILIAEPAGNEIGVSDATARKATGQDVRDYQERVRSLMADLLLAEEHERRRLAGDLHDGLSQTIALAQIKLAALRSSMGGKMKKSLDEIEALINQTNHTARTISFELSPPVLHDLGLEPALQWLVENIQARYGIQIVLEDDGQPKHADEKTRVILFRSIRELLINAAKHAGSRRVRVSLQREEDVLNALVEDDGVGMEADLVGVKGSGLFSIHERLNHVGGSMRIESTPGQGTKIRMRAPLTSRSPRKARVDV
jgi:signal transduction histidine kinase